MLDEQFDEKEMHLKWMELYELNNREAQELAFCIAYVADYDHGSDGHNRMHLVNKLSGIVDSLFEANEIMHGKILELRTDPEIGARASEIINSKE